MKKLSRKSLREIKAGSGGIGDMCPQPQLPKKCIDSQYPIYNPYNGCCQSEPVQVEAEPQINL
ncbi:hypothetical protein [Chryseobacterium sp. NFX27]|jgi:hypothetical protein|uniref:hypothetical protein n=1 Tax=Chryseobacterium sp. NFX27 TaxID=2819618 RepID=UPI003CEEEF5E